MCRNRTHCFCAMSPHHCISAMWNHYTNPCKLLIHLLSKTISLSTEAWSFFDSSKIGMGAIFCCIIRNEFALTILPVETKLRIREKVRSGKISWRKLSSREKLFPYKSSFSHLNVLPRFQGDAYYEELCNHVPSVEVVYWIKLSKNYHVF